MSKIEVGSVRAIHKRLREEGYLVGQSTLRGWIKQGVLPAVHVGNKALVAYANVIDVLMVERRVAPVDS